MIDCHIHTTYSPDGNVSPETVIKHAIKLRLKHIAIADHLDIDGATIGGVVPPLPDKIAIYIDTLKKLKQKYADKIYVSIGIEAGWSKSGEKETSAILKKHTPEYVINSIHSVDGIDCYWRTYFENQADIGNNRDTVYTRYFEAITESLDCPYPFHAVAHFDYIVRNAPYPDKIFKYTEFAPVLDKLLKKIIAYDKILEYNSSSYVAPLIMPQIFERYYALGGRKICFSSDAHTLDRIGDKYNEATKIMRDIGYKFWTVIQDTKPIKIIDLFNNKSERV